MKVKDLVKINKFYDGNVDFFYQDLLEFNQKDIELIISEIDKNNKNVKVLIDFLNWETSPDGNEKLDRLKTKLAYNKKYDIRDFIMTRILSVDTEELARTVFEKFDLDCSYEILEHIKDADEYELIIHCISSSSGNAIYSSECLENLEFILKNFKNDRMMLITKVMEYCQKEDLTIISLYNFVDNLDFLEVHIFDILNLLIKGYDGLDIIKLYNDWESCLYEKSEKIEPVEVNNSYNELIEFLKDADCSISGFDKIVLPFTFSGKSLHFYKDFHNMIEILKRVVKEEDADVLDFINRQPGVLSEKIMQRYYSMIIDEKHDPQYRNALICLSSNEFITDNLTNMQNINEALDFLERTRLAGNFDMLSETADFISKIKTPEIVSLIQVKNDPDNISIIKAIYSEFPSLLSTPIVTEELKEFYVLLLSKLTSLPSIFAFHNVMAIFKLDFVKNMSIDEKSKILYDVIVPENYSSLEYIKSAYVDMNEAYLSNNSKQNLSNKQPSYDIELLTVLELLDNGYNIEAVLDGFDDEDEINPKTLIRSLAYKNN